MTLLETLKAYSDTLLPMHMPGGKRRFVSDLPYRWDVTEVDGMDDLHDPHGILAEMQARACALWGADRSFVSVGGSTCGLLAAVRATGSGGLLLARNCHKSVYHAAELCRRQTRYVLPDSDGEISPHTVDDMLSAHPEITAAVITSPTYEGVISDIRAIADICHAHGVTLIADEAHGAHLGFSFGESAVTLGADIVVQSLHKTLPALTQTALIHCKHAVADAFAREKAVFESSSPSYLLMASADECFSFLASKQGKEQMQAYREHLLAVRAKLHNGMAHFRLAESPRYDLGKLVIRTDGTDCSGVTLAKRLRESFGIETEMALPDSLTAMTSVCDGPYELNRFADAVLSVDREVRPAYTPPIPSVTLPEQVCPAYALHETVGTLCPLEQAIGKVSLRYVWAYPPGIPLIVPGERADSAFVQTVSALHRANVPLQGIDLPMLCVTDR